MADLLRKDSGKNNKEKHPYVVSDSPKISINQDIEFQSDITRPKGLHLSEENKALGFQEPLTQDIITANLRDNKPDYVEECLSLSGQVTEFANETGIDLSGFQRILAREISNVSNVSKGKEGFTIQSLRTNWNITEEKKLSNLTLKQDQKSGLPLEPSGLDMKKGGF